jgi:site-specific DNA-methyltransferase (adenine-specific)
MKVTIGPATLYRGDCTDVLAGLPDASIHSCVVDPPYGLTFMGAKWDVDVPDKLVWSHVLRVLKPGSHLLSFFGTRTYHRGVVQIEDAGFEIRDQLAWIFGNGFPKSHDVSKGIDKLAGAERKVTRPASRPAQPGDHISFDVRPSTERERRDIPATSDAAQWQGWGTALKPAQEPIVLARKPFPGTVAANVLATGCGALNIAGSRVETTDVLPIFERTGGTTDTTCYQMGQARVTGHEVRRRWPANVIHDGSDEIHSGLGEAARFFYCAKASKKDRGEGNTHPTVKPTALMAHLCRMVTPPNGVVIDPFMGSGSTGVAAIRDGFGFIGIERDPAFFDIAVERMRAI